MRLFPIFCFLGGMAIGTAAAQIAVPLEEYRRQVLDYSHTLRQAGENTRAAFETMRGQHTGFLPQLSAEGDFSVNFRNRYASDGESDKLLRPYSFSLQPALCKTYIWAEASGVLTGRPKSDTTFRDFASSRPCWKSPIWPNTIIGTWLRTKLCCGFRPGTKRSSGRCTRS